NLTRFRQAKDTHPGEARRATNQFAETLYDEAIDALSHQEWGTAIRLAHQMRAESLTQAQLDQTWELLTVAHANNEDWQEALRYAERAPDTEPVREARRRAREALGQPDDSLVTS